MQLNKTKPNSNWAKIRIFVSYEHEESSPASCENGSYAICCQRNSSLACAYSQSCLNLHTEQATLEIPRNVEQCFFIAESVAPDQTAKLRRLVLSYAGRIFRKTNVCMTRMLQCNLNMRKENCVLIKFQQTLCFDNGEINS